MKGVGGMGTHCEFASKAVPILALNGKVNSTKLVQQ